MMSEYYTDVHSHILPGTDDGSKSMEETVQMLQTAYKQGIRRIIATPHYICGENNHTVDQLQKISHQVQEEATKIDSKFQIFLGNELYYSNGIIDDLKSKKALTLAGSRYTLIEFRIDQDYKTMYHAFREFVTAGFAPILAHIERYSCLVRREERLEELKKLGVYFQVNSSSLIGGFFDRDASYCRKLLSQRFIHLIGTDSHDNKYRPPMMEDAIKILRKKMDNRLLEEILFDNPEKILDDMYI